MHSIPKETKLWRACTELSDNILKYRHDYSDLLDQYDEKTLSFQLHACCCRHKTFQFEIHALINALKENPWESDGSLLRKKLIIKSILQAL